MSSDNSLVTFKAICGFTTELSEQFGKKQHSLKLYSRLISKTTLAHDKAIQKHINAFKSFCVENREAITTKNHSIFKKDTIEYSSRVFINMKNIFKFADNDEKTAIWKHLLTISAIVDPNGKAIEILKNSKDTEENNFLTDIIGKIEENVDPNANPMEAISSIMKSNIFNDLLGGMTNGLQNGNLDLGKLMGSVEKMASGLSEQAKEQEGGEQAVNMISTMMGTLNSIIPKDGDSSNNETPSETPDLSGIIGMMGPMLNMMTSNQNSQNDNINFDVLTQNNSNKNISDIKQTPDNNLLTQNTNNEN